MKMFELEKDGKNCLAQDNQLSVMEKAGWKKTGVVKGTEKGKEEPKKKSK
jgi:hypothetical protein